MDWCAGRQIVVNSYIDKLPIEPKRGGCTKGSPKSFIYRLGVCMYHHHRNPFAYPFYLFGQGDKRDATNNTPKEWGR
jgi:hypothetical protein